MINSPNFNSNNKFQLNAGVGLDHANVQCAISPINHFGLFTNAYLSSRGSQIEINTGYYKSNLIGDKWGGDVFLGYGAGGRNYLYQTNGFNLSSKSPFEEYSISNVFNRIVSQASIYNTINEHHQISFTLRETEIFYNRFNYNVNYFEGNSSYPNFSKNIGYINNKLHVTTFDFALTYRYRAKTFGLFVQFDYFLNNWQNPNTKSNIYFYRPLNIGVNSGLTIYFGRN